MFAQIPFFLFAHFAKENPHFFSFLYGKTAAKAATV